MVSTLPGPNSCLRMFPLVPSSGGECRVGSWGNTSDYMLLRGGVFLIRAESPGSPFLGSQRGVEAGTGPQTRPKCPTHSGPWMF